MKEKILPCVLLNLIKFKGSVNPKAVLGQVLRGNPELKQDVPGVLKAIEEIAASVSGKSVDEMKKELEKIAPELLEEKTKVKVEGPLKPLKGAEVGKVVLRIAPSPSGPLHIGHAYGSSLNYEYAKMYKGKFILRLEDTNPENIYEKAYEMIEADAQWLTEKGVNEVVVQSSRVELYHKYAEKLVSQGDAYVCECDADTWRENKNKGVGCACRELAADEQLGRWKKMFEGYAPGETVLRLKTEISHKNPAMRDFAMMRINDTVHPKIGKSNRVWPLMVLSVAIDDHELGLTHVLNGKDQHDNALKETMIMERLGWTPPIYAHWGFINFIGMVVSKTKNKIAIEQGEFGGWDDIRLPYLAALRRRGYQAGAFRKYATKIGLSLNDKTVTKEEFWKMINAFNREIVEPMANRYFFVANPIKITVNGACKKEVKMNLHDGDESRGVRILKGQEKILVSCEDEKDLLSGKVHRLIDYCNFRSGDEKYEFVSERYEDFKQVEHKGKIIHWLPQKEDTVSVEVLLDDNTTVVGVGEKGLRDVKVGEIVQLERMFFARLDRVEGKKMVFWYLHS